MTAVPIWQNPSSDDACIRFDPAKTLYSLNRNRAKSRFQRVQGFETEPSHKKDGTTNFKAKNVTGGSAPLKRDFGLGKKDDEPAAAAAPALDLASLGLQGGALGIPGLSLGIPGLAGLVPGLGLGGMSLPGLSAEHLAALAQPQMIPGLTPGLVSAAPGMAGFPTMPLVGAGLPAMGYVDPGTAASGEVTGTAPAV